jgi:hypothetical protein
MRQLCCLGRVIQLVLEYPFYFESVLFEECHSDRRAAERRNPLLYRDCRLR